MVHSQSSVIDLIHAVLIIPKLSLSTGKKKYRSEKQSGSFQKDKSGSGSTLSLSPSSVDFFSLLSFLYFSHL